MKDDEKITSTDVIKSESTARQITKHKRPKESENYQVNTNPGDNTKYLQNTLEISQLPRIDGRKPVEIRQRVFDYFDICMRNDMKPSWAGLALAFGITRQTLWERANGKTKKPLPQECIDEYQRAYMILNAQMEDYMQNGKINPVSGIFIMKNNMGYRDTQEYVLTPNMNAPERTPEELINEANQLPDSDD